MKLPTLNLNPHWRRTVLALIFGGAGIALLLFAGYLLTVVWLGNWPASLAPDRLRFIGVSLYITLALLGVVLIGLSMNVALRQVSGKFMGGEFSASGGEDDAVATVTTTTAVTTGSGS